MSFVTFVYVFFKETVSCLKSYTCAKLINMRQSLYQNMIFPNRLIFFTSQYKKKMVQNYPYSNKARTNSSEGPIVRLHDGLCLSSEIQWDKMMFYISIYKLQALFESFEMPEILHYRCMT